MLVDERQNGGIQGLHENFMRRLGMVQCEEGNYPSWKLEYLSLVELATHESEIGTKPFCITAIVRALSSLKTINGTARKEFLAGGVKMRELANYIGSRS